MVVRLVYLVVTMVREPSRIVIQALVSLLGPRKMKEAGHGVNTTSIHETKYRKTPKITQKQKLSIPLWKWGSLFSWLAWINISRVGVLSGALFVPRVLKTYGPKCIETKTDKHRKENHIYKYIHIFFTFLNMSNIHISFVLSFSWKVSIIFVAFWKPTFFLHHFSATLPTPKRCHLRWSDRKKRWCCDHHSKGCAAETPISRQQRQVLRYVGYVDGLWKKPNL